MKPNHTGETWSNALRPWAMRHAGLALYLVFIAAAVWLGRRDAAEHERSIRRMEAADARAVLGECRHLLFHSGPLDPAEYPPTVASLSPISVTVFDDHVDVRVYSSNPYAAGLVAYREHAAPVGGDFEKIVAGLWLYGRHRYLPDDLVGQY